jgi:hypothetical protein
MASTLPISERAAACTSADLLAGASITSMPAALAAVFSALTEETEFASPGL